MKRNIDAIIRDFNGQAIKDGSPTYRLRLNGTPEQDMHGDPIVLREARDLTLQVVCFNALRAVLPGDEKMDGKDKIDMYRLAAIISTGGVIDISAEDMTKLKDRVGRSYDFMTVGATFVLFDTDYVE